MNGIWQDHSETGNDNDSRHMKRTIDARATGQRTRSSRQRGRAGASPRAAVARSLAILETIGRGTPPVPLSEIARATGLSKATAHRLLGGLESSGFVDRDGPRQGYGLATAASRLGLALVSHGARPTDRRRILARLVDEIGETCNLTTLAGHEVIYLDRVETRWPL
ncbi:MAG: IclR family transcriptional regulator, partial [Parvibaculaceae bacterium]